MVQVSEFILQEKSGVKLFLYLVLFSNSAKWMIFLLFHFKPAYIYCM